MTAMRPPAFSEFCGQEKVKERLMLMVEAARMRGDVLDHVRRAVGRARSPGSTLPSGSKYWMKTSTTINGNKR